MTAGQTPNRWFAMTLDRVLVGLLIVQGLLFLSDRFDWFAFSKHKGRTVLIAVAVTGAVLLIAALIGLTRLAISWRTKKPPPQFGLRSMLLFVPVIAIASGWFGAAWNNAREQERASHKLQRSGGAVSHILDEDKIPPPPTGLSWLGDAFFRDVRWVSAASDEQIRSAWVFRETVGLNLDGYQTTDLGYSDVLLPDDGCSISDEGLSAISGMRKIQSVSINSDQVTNRGMESLQGFSNLEFLSLARTHIDDEGMAKLAGLRHVEYLDLGDLSLTSEYVWRIHRPVRFDDEPHERRRIEVALDRQAGSRNVNRKQIDLESPDPRQWRIRNAVPQQITDRVFDAIASWPKLETLRLAGTQVTGKGLGKLQSRSSLKALMLTNSPVDNSIFDELASFPELGLLDLAYTHITDDGLARWKETSRSISIWTVRLDRTRINGSGFQNWAGFPAMVGLELSGTDVNDDGLAHLAGLDNLVSLDVSQTRITGRGFEHLAKLKSLDSLGLADIPLDEKCLGILASCGKLQRLDLQSTPLTDAGFESLACINQLESLSVDGTAITDEGLRHIGALRHLKQLYLCHTAVTDKGLLELKSSKLTNLDVRHTQVTPAGTATLRGFVPGVYVKQ